MKLKKYCYNTRDKLSRKQRTIFNKLQQRTDIVIKKSDKGDKITVETTQHYIQDGLNNLFDSNIYHRVEEDHPSNYSKVSRP